MEYLLIGLCLIVLAAVIVFITQKQKTVIAKPAVQEVETPSPEESCELQSTMQEDTFQGISIPVEMLPTDMAPEDNKLIEITDSKILAHIDHLIPEFAQISNAVNNAMQAANSNGEVLYRAIIPANANLANSREMAEAFRGFYHGADGIRGHANLVPVEAQNGAAVLSNTAAAAMGIASMVVGQYYMTQINAELGHIGDDVSKIVNFNDTEFRSRVTSLVRHIAKIAKFELEILENDELRITKIVQLDRLEEECTKLLDQASTTLRDQAKKSNLGFEAYEKELQEAQNWYIYQNTLLEMLHKISELRYTLHLGNVSREQCATLLPDYTQQACEAQRHLKHWHQATAQRLSIDTTETRRKREGWDRAIHYFPGLFDDDRNFRPISERTADLIAIQSNQYSSPNHNNSEFYLEDVQLIKKGEKVYYLPNSNTK